MSAVEVAAQASCRSPELRAATRLALLWAERGERDQAYEILAPVAARMTPSTRTRDLDEADALLEALRRT